MKKNTDLSFNEMVKNEFEQIMPVIESLRVEIEETKKMLECTEAKFKHLADFRKQCADIIRDREEGIKYAYEQAEKNAVTRWYNALPWYQRIPKVDTGPGYSVNVLKKARDDIVFEEVERRKEMNPDKSLTAIFEEMGPQARNYGKRCSARTIRRIYETHGQNQEL